MVGAACVYSTRYIGMGRGITVVFQEVTRLNLFHTSKKVGPLLLYYTDVTEEGDCTGFDFITSHNILNLLATYKWSTAQNKM